jgi:hypothetical protein
MEEPMTRKAAGTNVTTILLLLAAACSVGRSTASPPPGAGASPAAASAVGYTRCMRSHGVPTFPDPDGSGSLPKADPRQLGVSSSQLRATRQACRHLLPAGGGAIDAGSIEQCFMAADCPGPLVRQVQDEERRFARCMRSHGVPNWPDPVTDSQGRPVFAISISKAGFNPYARAIWARGNRCSHLMPGVSGAPFQVSP